LNGPNPSKSIPSSLRPTCGVVEVAPLHDGRIGVRGGKRPQAGAVLFTQAGMGELLKGIKVGEFDYRT
jgi:hypothetical protein